MRTSSAVLLAALAGATFLPLGQAPAVASCAAPRLVGTEDLVLRRGEPAEVAGTGFVDGCRDAGSCSVGCTARCDRGPAPRPQRDVALFLRQDGRSWPLGTADARRGRDDAGSVSWVVTVPRGVRPGRAFLVLPPGQERVPVRVR